MKKFSSEEKAFIREHMPNINFEEELFDDDYVEIEDKIGDILVEEEFDSPEILSDKGKMAESILKKLV